MKSKSIIEYLDGCVSFIGLSAITLVILLCFSLYTTTEELLQPTTQTHSLDCYQYLFINANKSSIDQAQLDIVYNLRRDYIEKIHIIKVYNESYPRIATSRDINLLETPVWYFSSGVTTKGGVQSVDSIMNEVSNCWGSR